MNLPIFSKSIMLPHNINNVTTLPRGNFDVFFHKNPKDFELFSSIPRHCCGVKKELHHL